MQVPVVLVLYIYIAIDGVTCHMNHDHDVDLDDPDSVAKVVEDTEHIEEHYDGKVKVDWHAMSKNEKMFHFFKMNDFDENNLLDGLELWKGFNHWMGDFRLPKVGTPGAEREALHQKMKENRFRSLQNVVDKHLNYDMDDDGYLSFGEFVTAKETIANNRPTPVYNERSNPMWHYEQKEKEEAEAKAAAQERGEY